ncbi:hypothetical protein [Streptomyces sp. NPDC059918]|uniref:hypothetical protein n=1 Tax=unclassified Streptomyces TaxID=2593676 RepID=UPI003658B239
MPFSPSISRSLRAGLAVGAAICALSFAAPAQASAGKLCSGAVSLNTTSLRNVDVNVCVTERAGQVKTSSIEITNLTASNVFIDDVILLTTVLGGQVNCAPPNTDITIRPGTANKLTCASSPVSDTNGELLAEGAAASVGYWDPGQRTWTYAAFVSPLIN